MDTKKIVDFDTRSMIVNGKRIILIGGEFHYFRVPRALWDDRLRKVRQSGANLVSTYIPWNWHELTEGTFTWDGERDVSYFLDLCKKHGLMVAFKPGPYICAEWDNGGFPDWIIQKNVKLRLNDERYFHYVDRWYKEAVRIVLPYLFTKGGPVLLFQIENEYDHLREQQRDIIITKEEALAHLQHLLKLTRDAGVDIPVYTIEGCFVHGTEIIETRTFYPNIPWLWMWEFGDFDKKIQLSKVQQPDKPIFVCELQGGWFSQFGKPLYDTPASLTNAIIRNVIGRGASLVNTFMMVGGTTFPFWGCRGDARGDGDMNATGSITSYDFGCAPVREWGALSDKYGDMKSMSMMFKAFTPLFTDTDERPHGATFKAASGGTEVVSGISKADNNEALAKLAVLEKANDTTGLLLVRNLESDNTAMSITYTVPGSEKQRTIPRQGGNILVPGYTAYLLPLEVKIPSSELTIEHAASELLNTLQIGPYQALFVFGPKGIGSEIVLRGVKKPPRQMKGKIKAQYDAASATLQLTYTHNGVQMAVVDNVLLVILDNDEARKTWQLSKDRVMITDAYFVAENKQTKKGLDLTVQALNGATVTGMMFAPRKPTKILVEGKAVAFSWDKTFCAASFSFKTKKDKPVTITQSPVWLAHGDSAEKEIAFDDTSWQVIPQPTALEDVGLIKHGYVWYRAEVTAPADVKEGTLRVDTGIDRAYIYFNGELVCKGIGNSCVDLGAKIWKGKHVLAIRYENTYHTKGHPAEGPLVKRSGIRQPILVAGKVDGKEWREEIKSLKVKLGLAGLDKGYDRKEFSDSSWVSVPVAAKYVCARDMSDLAWFRRHFTYHKQAGWSAPVGFKVTQASERLMIYLNGQPLGKYESIGPQDMFFVPESMLQEENVLALVIEGPGYTMYKPEDRKPPFLKEPAFETFYEAKEVKIEIIG